MHKTSVKKNFMYQMIYEIFKIILPFITSPYIARVIGAEGLGIYSYTYSIAFYFVLFSMLGLNNYGNRIVAQNRDDQSSLNIIFSNIIILHIGISIVVSLAYTVYVVFFATDKLFAMIQALFVISGLFDISWFYFGIEKFKLTVTRSTVIKIINVILVFIYVKDASDLWKYCLIMALGTLVSQMILWLPLKKYVKVVKPNWKQMKIHIKPLLVLFIPAIAVSLYKYMNKIMIGTLSSKSQLGYYENAEKILNIPLTIVVSFGTVMLPKMSNAVLYGNKKQIARYIQSSMKYIMCLAFACAFGMAGIGTVFATVFWGRDFALSGTIIMGLAITVPFVSFANVIRTQYLIPTEKDCEYLVSVFFGAIINLLINWLLIPTLGAIGATFGTIAAEIVVCLIQAFSVRKELPLWVYIKNNVIFLFTGLIMFIIVFWIGRVLEYNVVTLFIQVLTGAIVYGSFSFLYFIKTRDAMFLNMLNKIKRKA